MPPKASSSAAATKTSSLWDRSDFLMDLSIALYQVAEGKGALDAQMKDAVANYLNAQGHEVGWNAIRAKQAMSRQLMKWDPKVHEDILVVLFQHLTLPNDIWDKIMHDLHQMGYPFSESALRQHVQKLRKNRDTSGIQAASGGGSKPSTPRKSNGAGKKRATPSKRSAMEDLSQDDDEEITFKKEEDGVDTDGVDETPKHANKRAKKATIAEIKFDEGEF